MKLNRFFRFALVGSCGFLVDVCTLYVLLFFGMDYLYGRFASFLVAVFFTWQLNRNVTFTASPHISLCTEAWRYLLAASTGGIVNLIVYSVVVFSFSPSLFVPLLGVALGSGAGMCVNYFAAKNFVFRSKEL